ncbi:hypothetical protein IV203_023081 [Nitzschia inconspicua]|uniref:Uncharacterized protein n=1 Tax=Nitzschia inconspicua TaxID=303405 RepID=A0A9K3KDF3_9STRA|nr:hypothetical protein IV203_023081 [Nitzschia inconspicua]
MMLEQNEVSRMYSFDLKLIMYPPTLFMAGYNSAVARPWRGLEAEEGKLPSNEVRCYEDSQAVYDENPALSQIIRDVPNNIHLSVDEINNKLDIRFNQEYLDGLEAVCSDASGLFVYLNETDFICEYMGEEMEVDLDNFAQCLANTAACQSLDTIKFVEKVWDSVNLECRVVGEPVSPPISKPYYHSSTGMAPPSNGRQSYSPGAGLLVAKISFLLFSFGAIAYIIRKAGGQQQPTSPTYEMINQVDRSLT